MRTLIVYDSLYGNTKIIAQTIADVIQGEVNLKYVGDVDVSELGDYDLLIVGAPTHGGGISEATKGLLGKIQSPALEGTKVAAFDTRITNKWILIFGVAAPKIAKELEKVGGELVVPAEGFFVTGGEGPLKDGEVERAQAWGESILNALGDVQAY